MPSRAEKGKARMVSPEQSDPKETQQAIASRYPPGIGDIINRKHRTKGGITGDCDADPTGTFTRGNRTWSWPPAAFEWRDPGPSQGRPIAAPVSSENTESFGLSRVETLSPRTALPSAQDTEAAFVDMTACDQAVRSVRELTQSLAQIRDGMWTTLCEYFHRVFICTLELPAFYWFRKAVDRLIKRLETVVAVLEDAGYLSEDCPLREMLVDIEGGVRSVVGEGFSILRFWKHREKSQKLGEPLQGKCKRLRGIAIHDSNKRVGELRKSVNAAEARILGQKLLLDRWRQESFTLYIRAKRRLSHP